MAWPVDSLYETLLANVTTVKAATHTAIQQAIVNAVGGAHSLKKMLVDGTGDQVAAYGSGQVANINNGTTRLSNGTGDVPVLELKRASTTTPQPLFKAMDADGNVRRVIDHRGFLFGRVNRWLLNWDRGQSTGSLGTGGAIAAPFGDLTFARVGTAAVAEAWGMSAQIGCQTGGVYMNNVATFDIGRLYSTQPVIANNTNCEAAIEFEINLSNTTDNFLTQVGLSVVGADETNAAFFKFQPGINSGQWQAQVNAGNVSQGLISSSQAPSTGAWDYMRIEVYGTGTPTGKKFVFILNGVVIGSVVPGTVPTGDYRFEVMSWLISGTGKTNQVSVGQVTAEWARTLSPSLP
jgi:hypothetical protein